MKRTFILLTVLIFANLASIGQNLCATKASFVNTLANTSLDNCTTVTVNLRFHIVRNTDGSGGQANTVIPTIINYLNTSFNPQRIYFNNLGNDEILNDEYSTNWGSSACTSKFDNLILINNFSNAINIYLLDNDTWNQGRANTIPGTSIIIGGKLNGVNLIPSYALAHELGHCLNLFHTHHGCPSEAYDCSGNAVVSVCLENPNGTNGDTCGDFVADTPADPFINFNTNSNCSWNGTIDNITCKMSNVTYNPDGTNIMAYVHQINCMNHFTNGQGARMRTELIRPGSILQNVRTYTQAPPNLSSMTYDGGSTVNTVNFIASGGHNIYTNITPTNLTSAIIWNPNFSGGSGIVSGINNINYILNLSSSQSVTFNISATNSCGTSTRNPTFTVGSGFRAFPIPTNSTLTVEFDPILVKLHQKFQEDKKNKKDIIDDDPIPDRIYLINDKNETKKEFFLFNQNDLSINNISAKDDELKFQLDLSNFLYGVYFLKVDFPGKQSQTIKIIIEN